MPQLKTAQDNNYYLGTLFQLDKDAATREVFAENFTAFWNYSRKSQRFAGRW